MDGLSITGLGQVSNVGPTAEASCAAQRAGITRLAPVEGITTYDPEEMETQVLGAPVQGVTEGLFHSARWVALGERALNDLARDTGTPLDDASTWDRAALLWVLPALDFERFQIPEEVADRFLEAGCADVLLPLSRSCVRRENVGFIPEGPVGVALAAIQARQLLKGGGISRVVVLAADSWLDPMSLMHLGESGRLKQGDQPFGFFPGECAACVVLEAAGNPRSYAGVTGVSAPETSLIPDESDLTAWRTANAPGMGAAMATAVRAALEEGGTPLPFRGDLILDLNGEQWRALAWGYAQTGLSEVLDLSGCRVILPSTSFGDIGAAGPLAGLCIASRSFSRGYCSGASTVVVSLSDLGRAAAIVVGRDGTP